MDHRRLQKLVSDPAALRGLVGRRVRYMQREYEIADMLPEEGLMILSSEETSDLQEDSYGRPHRLVPGRQSVHFRDAEGQPTHVWEDLSFLDGPMEE